MRRKRKNGPAPAEGMKWCSHCQDWLPLDRFSSNRSQPDGKQGYCREYYLFSQKEYYRNDLENRRTYRKAQYAAGAEEAREAATSWYYENIDQAKAAARDYYDQNSDKIKQQTKDNAAKRKALDPILFALKVTERASRRRAKMRSLPSEKVSYGEDHHSR